MPEKQDTFVDFTPYYSDYALFTPAISEMYSRYVQSSKVKKRFPWFDRKWLDFLQKDTPFYYVPYALYSAGQGVSATKEEDQVLNRDKNTSLLLGDSGGFQIQTGVLKWKGDQTREEVLRWLEEHADWSMILDFPTGSIDMVVKGKTFAERYGIQPGTEFDFCLKMTKENNDYFVQHRVPGKTNFLNVIQGRTDSESSIWYESVKDYPFEGWALAGAHNEDFHMTMKRILKMRDDGNLDNKNWIHFLGKGRVKNGCIFTTIQRNIRKHINPNLCVSYDVSSPFSSAVYGSLFYDFEISKNKWGIYSDKGPDSEKYIGSETTLEEFILEEIEKRKKKTPSLNELFENEEQINYFLRGNSPITKYITLGDICVERENDGSNHEDFSTDMPFEGLERKKERKRSTWDLCSYAYIMNHNTYVQMSAILEAHRFYDSNRTDFLPSEMMEIKNIIEESFERENWVDFLDHHAKKLKQLNKTKSGKGISTLSDQSLFEL